MSKDVSVHVTMDDSDIQAKLAKNQGAIDAQAADWRSKRNQILLEMSSINMGISMMVQSIRMVARITGQTLDPIQGALLGMVTSTASLMVAMATALATTGIMAGAALILAAAAWSMQVGQTIKIYEDFEKLKGDFADIDRRLAEMGTGVASQAFGRPF